jgi:predicted ArsR family transcriptional regulator
MPFKARAFSATYCSCGWYRQLFETLLDGPVEVELLGSIVQGDERCRFLIHTRGLRSNGA